eukprot:SAG11_NODE_1748_length_4320_cov_19.924899_3_plen_265_part_00
MLVNQTLSNALVDVAHFMISFLAAFACFSLCATVMFGLKMKAFSNPSNSFHSLFEIATGDYTNLEEMRNLYPGGMGMLFQYTFIFFMGFVMVNIFLAIIMDAYANVMTNARTTGAATLADDYSRAMTVLYKRGLSKNFKSVITSDRIKAIINIAKDNDILHGITAARSMSILEMRALKKTFIKRQKPEEDAVASIALQVGHVQSHVAHDLALVKGMLMELLPDSSEAKKLAVLAEAKKVESMTEEREVSSVGVTSLASRFEKSQ